MKDTSLDNKKVILLQFEEEKVDKLTNFLLKHGYSSQLVPYSTNINFKSLTQDPDTNYFFVVFCGENREICFKNVTKLLKIKDILNFPILIIGMEAYILDSIISQNVAVNATLSYPYLMGEVLTGLKYIEKTYTIQKNLISQDDNQEKTILATEQTPFTNTTDKTKSNSKNNTDNDTTAVINYIFNKFLSFGILKKEFHGKNYSKLLKNVKDLGTEHLPKNDIYLSLVNEISSHASPWGEKHFHRVAYIVHSVLSSLYFDEELLEDAKATCFFYGYVLVNEKSPLIKNDYLGSISINYKNEFSKKILEAKELLSSKYNSQQINAILSCMANIICGKNNNTDDAIFLIASTIILADIVDKSCWQTGCWNPRACYRIFNTFEEKSFVICHHPVAICCILKFLSEATVDTDAKFFLSGKTASNPQNINNAKEIKTYNSKKNEEKVEIPNLSKDMCLSKPLTSFQGNEILKKDTTLDNELVWRIWKLTSMEPINSPTIVKKKKK